MSAVASPRRFRASCPDCRSTAELDARAFRLALGRTKERTFYSFTCPACGVAVRKHAGDRIIAALTGAGVPTMRLHVGA
ncbi:hypothetical protein ABIA32_003502 [Streptacidiphilus sp. MAP12-20]|uniref:hypothetical protein n=1 Tax=Streptacidiphilus sp. MAP12-20 TaxID=3156299 RepID=UPI00351779C4